MVSRLAGGSRSNGRGFTRMNADGLICRVTRFRSLTVAAPLGRVLALRRVAQRRQRRIDARRLRLRSLTVAAPLGCAAQFRQRLVDPQRMRRLTQ
jgi:hypothetical protein